jgi:hypothetical protein
MRQFITALSALALAGCVHTQEMPLAPNIVRIDTQASGLLYQGKAAPTTMVAAANATLSRGYTHFKIADPRLGQGSERRTLADFRRLSWAVEQATISAAAMQLSEALAPSLAILDRRLPDADGKASAPHHAGAENLRTGSREGRSSPGASRAREGGGETA